MIPEEFTELFPDLTDAKRSEAYQNLDEYLKLAWEIADEPSTEPPVDSDKDDR